MITPENELLLDSQIEFMHDLELGLSKESKEIPSKYFYNKKGCELFNAITRHEDYYLTQCEIDILTCQKQKFSNLFIGEAFNLIELGPGEGIKTKIILDQLIRDKLAFTYVPIDISKEYLNDLSLQFLQEFPGLQLKTIEADWLSGLKKSTLFPFKKNIVLFLGSSIGNFTPQTSIHFLKEIAMTLTNGDYLFIGFDLCKEQDILLRAYNDSSGITRQFNLNLLERINKDLGGDFNITQFEHRPRYNFSENAMESYLVSTENQYINIRSMNKTFYFNLNEEIHVESSHKYNLEKIEMLATLSGFSIVENFHDSKRYFVCSLWRSNT